jgi:gliding motility-associated-like protein
MMIYFFNMRSSIGIQWKNWKKNLRKRSKNDQRSIPMRQDLTLSLLITFFITVTICPVKSQVFPPDLICIENDTLKWELPINTCGNFIAYDIYVSTDLGIPFALLTSVSDQGETQYYHENLLGEKRFYYMTSQYDCPGEEVLSSDTLDNMLPIAQPISSVSVVNGQVRLNWRRSPSPETIGYIVYKETNIGTIPIDTTFSDTTYIDPAANPEDGPVVYYVIALDACGNASLFGLPHQTIFLEASQEGCVREAELNWTPYQNWPQGAAYQEIWVSADGEDPVFGGTTGGSASTFLYDQINDSTDYCFYIKSVRADLRDSAWSNAACFYTDIIQPVRNFFITNVSFTSDEELQIDWSWNTNAELELVSITRGTDTTALASIESYAPGYPLPPSVSYSTSAGTATSIPTYFQIRTIDQCQKEEGSTIARPILLSGNSPEKGVNSLSWVPLQLPNSTTEELRLFKVSGLQPPALLATPDPSDEEYVDFFDAALSENVNVCYFLEAIGFFTFPDGTTQPFLSRSNTACIDQIPRIFIPNAFTPRGKNPEFKPVFLFRESVRNYSMTIYDRWGRQLFETRSLDEGWRGRSSGGAEISQGMYLYMIQYELPSGEKVLKKGNVMLLR